MCRRTRSRGSAAPMSSSPNLQAATVPRRPQRAHSSLIEEPGPLLSVSVRRARPGRAQALGGKMCVSDQGTIGLSIAGRTAMWSRSSTCGWRRARRHPRSRLRGTCGRRAAQRSRRGRAAAIHAAVVQQSMGNCPHVSSPPRGRRRHPSTDGYSRGPASPTSTARTRAQPRPRGRRRRCWTACTAADLVVRSWPAVLVDGGQGSGTIVA
jgi:hypothetical protein